MLCLGLGFLLSILRELRRVISEGFLSLAVLTL